MYPRSEFPVEKLPVIVRANGSISRAALKTHFSAMGCPGADTEVAAAVIRSGGTSDMAIQVAILAAHYTNQYGSSIEPMERTMRQMLNWAKERNAKMHPCGKEAEDRAARLEGRESRWGMPDFHRTNIEDVRTKHYPHETYA